MVLFFFRGILLPKVKEYPNLINAKGESMKSKVFLVMGMAAIGACALLLTACPTPVNNPNASPSPSIVPGPTEPDLSDHVKAGIQELIDRDYTGAKTEFATAIALNSADNDAKLWVSLMDLATVSVDPAVVDLFKNRLGFVDYPSAMDQLFSDGWFNGEFYLPHGGFALVDGSTDPMATRFVRGDLSPTVVCPYSVSCYDSTYNYSSTTMAFVPNDAGQYYASWWYEDNGGYWEYKTSSDEPSLAKYVQRYDIIDSASTKLMLPKLEIPAWYASFANHAAGDLINVNEYGMILMANVASRNPNGLNAILDSVKTVALGSSLNQLIARIESLSDTERIYLPWNLLESYAGTARPPAMAGKYVTLGKPELLLFAAQLKIHQATVQYLSSVNMDSPDFVGKIADYLATQDMDDTEDADLDGIPNALEGFYAATDGFFNSTLLTNRSANIADRAASKASVLEAIADLESAGALLKLQWADSASYYNDMATTLEMPAEARDVVGPAIQRSIQLCQKLAQAINADSTLILPIGDMDDILSDGFQWPTVDDNTTAVALRPGALWASNILDPRSWLELKADNSGFKTYLKTDISTLEPNYVTGSYEPICFAYDGQALSLADYGNPQTVTGLRTVRASAALCMKVSRVRDFLPNAPDPESLYDVSYGFGPVFYPYSTDSGVTTILNPPAGYFFFIDWLNKPAP
jgi:hypothetical protein